VWAKLEHLRKENLIMASSLEYESPIKEFESISEQVDEIIARRCKVLSRLEELEVAVYQS
jgi:hypothetical protein